MKKWIMGVGCSLLLAGLIVIPTGCGPGETSKIDSGDYQAAPPAGHAEALKEMQETGG